jgi:RNA polymerase sigma-70 factor (ECF subfamily)
VRAIVSEPLAQPERSKINQGGKSLSKSPLASTAPRTTALSSDSPSSPYPLTDSEFGELYNEHSRAIYYLALRFLSDPQKAEDATHDVFLKAFRKMGQFRGESSWRTWLYRIGINHCRNLQQTWNERHIFSNADEAIFETTAAKTDSPLRVLETKELGQRIQKALDGLPAEYRLLLLLVADEQLSYEEVGALTEQTPDAVRGKLHRARKAFTTLFQQGA